MAGHPKCSVKATAACRTGRSARGSRKGQLITLRTESALGAPWSGPPDWSCDDPCGDRWRQCTSALIKSMRIDNALYSAT